ncbi:MAG: ATP synthase F1 subunit epsilon [Alphaproteobacteria bacterium]
MADTMTFSLVSPERELFSGQVTQVDIPGTEGDMGILPNHMPVMAAIRTGSITVYADGGMTKYFVQGGFADATPEGLTVLAESAALMSEVDANMIAGEIEAAKKALEGLKGDALLMATQNFEGLNAVASAL